MGAAFALDETLVLAPRDQRSEVWGPATLICSNSVHELLLSFKFACISGYNAMRLESGPVIWLDQLFPLNEHVDFNGKRRVTGNSYQSALADCTLEWRPSKSGAE
jgi:hypothetical protein